MNMSVWINSPLAQYGALALGLLICLVLFVSLKIEIAKLRRMVKEERETRATAATEAAAAAKEPVTAPAVAAVPLLAAPLPGPDLNLTTRAQALRMQHRGESVNTIAGALRAPRNEIELLLKVQTLLVPEGSK